MSQIIGLLKIAWHHSERGIERILFVVLGANLAFLMCYAFFCLNLAENYKPMLPAGYAIGGFTLSGIMVIAAATAVINTIYTGIFYAILGCLIGYAWHFCRVAYFYDNCSWDCGTIFDFKHVPQFLLRFKIFQDEEEMRVRQKLVDDIQNIK
jgi:hypothetical protein